MNQKSKEGNTMENSSYGMQPYAPQYTGVNNAYAPGQKIENAFKPDISDFLFALVTFALGYLFSRWVFTAWQGWGVSVFTTAYLLAATAYLIKKGAFAATGAAFFWMAITWAAGISYALWDNVGFSGTRALFLLCSAVYYIIIASDSALMGKTGNYLLIDGFNAVIIIPFRNYFNQYVSFIALRKRTDKPGKGLPVFLGAVLAIVLAVVLIPMLEQADSGGFGMILGFFRDIFSFRIAEFAFFAIISIPMSAYIYGLVSGAAHRKGTTIMDPESAGKAVSMLRFLQPATIYIALGAVCGLYLVFIFSQTPYFFSAFSGNRPDGWLVYAEYARRGFFELCGIAAINLGVLTACNIMCEKRRIEARVLKIFNIALAVITLLLIATAFSKMAMYIDIYGLTMPRLLPCVFMVLLAAVFVALIALQKWDFSIVRFALVTGAVMLCALCLCNPDALVVRYNTERYLCGTLPEYDLVILRRAGGAGIRPALEVYEHEKTGDSALKYELYSYLTSAKTIYDPEYNGGIGQGAHTLSLESHQAHKALLAFP